MLKQYLHYRIDFSAKAVTVSGTCIGVYLFLTVLHNFFLEEIRQLGFGALLFDVALPIIMCIAYIVLFYIIRFNAPGIYGILGAAFSVLFMISAFSGGGVVRILLAVIWYLVCGLLILLTAGGFLPKIPLSVAAFMIAFAVRILFFDLGNLTGKEWIPEIGVLSGILAMAALPFSFKEIKVK